MIFVYVVNHRIYVTTDETTASVYPCGNEKFAKDLLILRERRILVDNEDAINPIPLCTMVKTERNS